MANVLQRTHQRNYYNGHDEAPHGSYQFVSLKDIVTNFIVSYVGEDKIIPKIRRIDVAFHAKRVLQELSFDTLKSFKSHQIELPPSLQMILPHDYVNYTKISWVDDKGIKHPVYPTRHTNNPFHIRQDDDKNYWMESGANLVKNGDFSSQIFLQGNWRKGGPATTSTWTSIRQTAAGNQYPDYEAAKDVIGRYDDTLQFKHRPWTSHTGVGSKSYSAFQKIDVRGVRFIDFKATGKSAGQATSSSAGDMGGYGVLRAGIISIDPTTGLKPDGSVGWAKPDGTAIVTGNLNPFHNTHPSPNYTTTSYDLRTQNGNKAFVKWDDGSESEKTIDDIDVSDLDYIWVYIQSFVPFTPASITEVDEWDHDSNPSTGQITTAGRNVADGGCTPTTSAWTDRSINKIDNISITTSEEPNSLMNKNISGNSDTWDNYKSSTPSENNTDNYEDNTYWPNNGERYGLEPSHAQINGSFFIDDRLGKIHFSSNISGKNIILDYISDTVGTDEEMQVHKFAEEAMYKSMLYNIMCTRRNVSGGQLMLYKKEKFAATRNAKLRLSNIKLEELTQILRDKSKWIK